MKQLASAQQERDALQQETTDQKEEISRWVPHPLHPPPKNPQNTPVGSLHPYPIPIRLTRGRDALQRECGELSQELREATECREVGTQIRRHRHVPPGGSRPAAGSALGADILHVGLLARG